MAKVRASARVAALLHHGVQAAGTQAGVLGQGLLNEGQVGIDLARSGHQGQARHAGPIERAQYGIAVYLELARDGAHAPAFVLVQAQDLGAKLDGDGHGSGPLCQRSKFKRSAADTLVPQKWQWR